jgi:hypothetical protein
MGAVALVTCQVPRPGVYSVITGEIHQPGVNSDKFGPTAANIAGGAARVEDSRWGSSSAPWRPGWSI